MELSRQGHHPVVYCPRLGVVSNELLNFGIPVLDDVRKLPQPDIIHGNSRVETVAAILQFPQTPAIFVGHAWRSPDTAAPRMPNIVRYLAVGEHARQSLVYFSGIPEEMIVIHQNPTDLQRFQRRAPLPGVPRRALILSNSVSEQNCLEIIERACRRAGITVDAVGLGAGTARLDTENILAGYDIVFAKGRSALDALATGCAVILCDANGLGESITTENYDFMRFRNFGVFTWYLPVTEETLLAQLKRYDPRDAALVTDRVRGTEGLFASTVELVEIYEGAIDTYKNSQPVDLRSLTCSAAQFLDTIAPFANTFYLAEHTAPLERALRASEAKLRRLPATLGMKRMDEAELSRLKIEILSCPAVLEPGGTGEVVVRVHNGSASAISSLGDFPINIASHWYDQNAGLVFFEGARSELFPPLLPGQSYTYAAQFVAPTEPGKYVLRMTLVQEAVKWLDELGVYDETSCTLG